MSRRSTRQAGDNCPSPFAANLNVALRDTTSEAFARKINVTLRTVQRWRSGDSTPNGLALMAVARELDVPAEDLFVEPEQKAA